MCFPDSISMISFIVIGKNEGWRLEKCLTAIKRLASSELAQPYEIIYVDSQSTDDSIRFAKQYADRVYLITGECSAAMGRNVGGKEATGDILFFLDGDMELLPGVLTTIFTEDGELVSPFLSGAGFDIFHDASWKEIETCPRQDLPGLMVIERKRWYSVGGMDTKYHRCEDYELIWRLHAHGTDYRQSKQSWVNHYTRYPEARSESLSVHRFFAMLTRNYLFDKTAFMTLFLNNYSAFTLFVSCILLITTREVCILIPYMLLLFYRAIRVIRRTGVRLHFTKILFKRFLKDLVFIFYFFTFFPKRPTMSYTKVK